MCYNRGMFGSSSLVVFYSFPQWKQTTPAAHWSHQQVFHVRLSEQDGQCLIGATYQTYKIHDDYPKCTFAESVLVFLYIIKNTIGVNLWLKLTSRPVSCDADGVVKNKINRAERQQAKQQMRYKILWARHRGLPLLCRFCISSFSRCVACIYLCVAQKLQVYCTYRDQNPSRTSWRDFRDKICGFSVRVTVRLCLG